MLRILRETKIVCISDLVFLNVSESVGTSVSVNIIGNYCSMFVKFSIAMQFIY